MAVSIIPQLIKGVKGSRKLKKILETVESADRRKIGNENLNKKLEIIAFRFQNPNASIYDMQKFGVQKSAIDNYLREANLPSLIQPGLKPSTKKELKEFVKGYKKLLTINKKNKIEDPRPSKDELSTFLGYVKSGKASKASRLTDQIQKVGEGDPDAKKFMDLDFKLGTATRGGEFDAGEIARLKKVELDKFYADPSIPKEVKQLRRDIDKTIKEYNKLFIFDKKVIDHIDSYWNAAAKEVPYEDVANWQIIGKKINGVKAALYENPKAGLLKLSKDLKKAKGKTEQRALLAKFDEQMLKHKKIVDDAEVILKLDGIDGIPNKFTRYADKNYKEFTGPMNQEKLIKQLDEMQEMIDARKSFKPPLLLVRPPIDFSTRPPSFMLMPIIPIAISLAVAPSGSKECLASIISCISSNCFINFS